MVEYRYDGVAIRTSGRCALRRENDMHNLVPIGTFFGGFFGGLGIFFIGCAAFWFVSVYQKKSG